MATLPIAQFLTAQLQAYDSSFEIRAGTGFYSLFFEPMQFIVQPLRDELNDMFIGQSLLRISSLSDPDNFPEDKVDAIISNIYVPRREGLQSSGIARVYYNTPVDREYPATGFVVTGSNGLTYSNPAPYNILSTEMGIQIDTNGLYYMDVPVQSDDLGLNTALAVNNLVSLANDTDYVLVTNLNAISGGLDHETNTQYIIRAQNSIGVRDLVAEKGFRALLFAAFSDSLLEIQPIGFGDPEMMRNII